LDETSEAENSVPVDFEKALEFNVFPLYRLIIKQYRTEMLKTADIFRNLFTARKYNI